MLMSRCVTEIFVLIVVMATTLLSFPFLSTIFLSSFSLLYSSPLKNPKPEKHPLPLKDKKRNAVYLALLVSNRSGKDALDSLGL